MRFETLPFHNTNMVRFLLMQEPIRGRVYMWEGDWAETAQGILAEALAAIEVHEDRMAA